MEKISKNLSESSSKALKEAAGATDDSVVKTFGQRGKEALGQAFDFLKKNPKLAALGIGGAVIATYALTTGKSVGEAAGELAAGAADVAIDAASPVAVELAKAAGEAGSTFIEKGPLGDIFGPYAKSIKESFQKYKMIMGIACALCFFCFLFMMFRR